MEQKYWYEELGFGLTSDCIRCIDCRKEQQGIAQQLVTYESLYHVEKRNEEQHLCLANVCLSLIESRVFTKRKTELVRRLLNCIPTDSISRSEGLFAKLVERTIAVEKRDEEQRIARDLRLARFFNRD